jgi:NAD(P)-dependent dehydrogenase (short-subunit alcohol dehydrogenase family)
VFLVTKQFIDGMAERGWGRVINISSVIGEVGNFGQVNYAAAKAAVIGFTKALAREYARKGVTVNAVAPGFIKTQMTEAVPQAALDAVMQATPVGRLGEPAEVAGGVLYLASDVGAFITGHVLDINGGYAM